MPDSRFLMIQVSLKGRALRTYSFTSECVSVGRDPESDVVLDNPGVSRNHLEFEWTSAGYVVKDLGSANGTYLNDEPLSRDHVSDDDVIRVGKFSLSISLTDKRAADHGESHAPTTAVEGTTVLSRDQLARVIESSKAEEAQAALRLVTNAKAAPEESEAPHARRTLIIVGVSAMVAGVLLSLLLGRLL